jgi:hypothetical protein
MFNTQPLVATDKRQNFVVSYNTDSARLPDRATFFGRSEDTSIIIQDVRPWEEMIITPSNTQFEYPKHKRLFYVSVGSDNNMFVVNANKRTGKRQIMRKTAKLKKCGCQIKAFTY